MSFLATRLAALLLLAVPLAFLPAAAQGEPDPSAGGFCIMGGVDEAPWDNWIVVLVCGPAPDFTGWSCTGVSLVWVCNGANGSGNTEADVTIESLEEILPL